MFKGNKRSEEGEKREVKVKGSQFACGFRSLKAKYKRIGKGEKEKKKKKKRERNTLSLSCSLCVCVSHWLHSIFAYNFSTKEGQSIV